MKTVRIPLIGQLTQRGYGTAGETVVDFPSSDQSFRNALFSVFSNPVTGKQEIFAQGWATWTDYNVPSSPTGEGTAVLNWTANATNSLAFAFGNTNSTIYVTTTSKGDITGTTSLFSQTKLNGTALLAMRSSDSTGWYLMSDAIAVAFNGDTSTGTPTVINIASTTGLYSGMAISGTGIPASTRILTVDSATQITMNANATGTATVSITPTPIAKILDADFPGNAGLTPVGAIQFMDGYPFILTSNGRLYNGDLNSITAWQSTNYVSFSDEPGGGIAAMRYKQYIACFGRQYTEFFYNAGNAAGSPLSRVVGSTLEIGASSANAVIAIGDTIAFVGKSSQSGVGIYMLEGLKAKKISNATIDRSLELYSGSARLYRMAHRGKMFIAYRRSTLDNAVSVYDVDLGIWSIISGPGENITACDTIYSLSVGTPTPDLYNNSTIACSSGDTWLLKTDAGNGAMTVITEKLDFGSNNQKVMHSIRLIGDQSSATANAGISFSDNDYDTFNTVRNVDISNPNPQLRRCGMFRKRAIRIDWPAAGSKAGNGQDGPRLKAIEVTYEDTLL